MKCRAAVVSEPNALIVLSVDTRRAVLHRCIQVGLVHVFLSGVEIRYNLPSLPVFWQNDRIQVRRVSVHRVVILPQRLH